MISEKRAIMNRNSHFLIRNKVREEQVITAAAEENGERILPVLRKIRYTYDKAGRNMVVKNEFGSIHYGYNAVDFVTKEEDEEGNETRYDYDRMCNLIRKVSPNAKTAGTVTGTSIFIGKDTVTGTGAPNGTGIYTDTGAVAGQPTRYDRPEEGSDLLLGPRMKEKARNTQICPQCDWEIDAGYRVCPHCHFYLAGK